ncbi:TauD/TfdA family dioxygenase [Photorhabdus heterorhabditis]|uniref:TauD/TfdA family dioxygenase n=1 Tax=Photorhabdus heterorhabditis TaxID=880156 RepID=UPI0015627FC6|nr:TauD/TfdA family dioxygenase [Photorhabdus heterorhabditis]NRN29894.1 clavaminate synthase [Photorhabdus heterorhabditis subsp. aluminescens]
MKNDMLSIVYDSYYINSSNHQTIKNAIFNIITFLKYHGFSVHDSDSFLSSNKRNRDIDIFITTNEKSTDNDTELPRVSIIFPLYSNNMNGVEITNNKYLKMSYLEFPDRTENYLSKLDGNIAVNFEGESHILHGYLTTKFTHYKGWQTYLTFNNHVIGIKKEVNGHHFYCLGIINSFSSRYFSENDNEKFLKSFFSSVCDQLNHKVIFNPEMDFSDVSPKFSEKYLVRDLAKLKGDHILNIDHDALVEKGIYENPLPNPYENINYFLSESYKRITYLNKNIIQKLYEFKNHANQYGILLLKGIDPGDCLPSTPLDSLYYPDKGNFFGEMWLAMIAEFLGYAVSYTQEKQGNVFQNLVPHPGKEILLSSASSKKELDFHTEIAFHPHMCDYVLLYCLRQDHDKKAKTFTASARMIIPYLSLNEYKLLFEPIFITGIDYSYGSPNGKKGNGPITPVFHGDPNDPYMIYDLDLMEGINSEAEILLDKLKKLANKNKVWATLEKGDLLIINNNRCVHGRSEFIPRYDGKDRWLLRTCVLNNIIPASSDILEQSRTINTRFIV